MRPKHFFTAGQWFGEPGSTARDYTAIDRWNAAVGPDDLVWVLGGFTAGAVDPASYLRLLHGVKYLVAGPGDDCWAGYDHTARDQAMLTERYVDAGFKAVVNGRALARRYGRPVHIPLRMGLGVDVAALSYDWSPVDGDRFDAIAVWRPKRPKSTPVPWLVHGEHVAELVHARQVSVAALLWDFEPVSAEVVASLVQSD